MAYRGWISGIGVVVLCQVGTLAACGGSATDEKSDDPAGAGGDGSGSTSGDGDGDSPGDGDGDGDGDSGGTGGTEMGTGGTGDDPILCGDVAFPVGTIILVGAPVEEGNCLASIEITGLDTQPDIFCAPVEEGCACGLWSGSLTEGTNSIRVLDEGDAPIAVYSGPYTPAESTDPCGGPVYETIEINYVVSSPDPEHRDASFCPVNDFTAECEDPGYYQFELHVGCGLSRFVQLDDSYTYDLIFKDLETGEIVYHAVRPDVGGGCNVYVDETEGVPTCDEWTLEPCDP